MASGALALPITLLRNGNPTLNRNSGVVRRWVAQSQSSGLKIYCLPHVTRSFLGQLRTPMTAKEQNDLLLSTAPRARAWRSFGKTFRLQERRPMRRPIRFLVDVLPG